MRSAVGSISGVGGLIGRRWSWNALLKSNSKLQSIIIDHKLKLRKSKEH